MTAQHKSTYIYLHSAPAYTVIKHTHMNIHLHSEKLFCYCYMLHHHFRPAAEWDVCIKLARRHKSYGSKTWTVKRH